MRLNREKMEKEMAGSSQWHFFSPALFAQYRAVLPLIKRYAKGKVIDLGCGYMPFKEYLKDTTAVYHTLDLHPRLPDTTYIGDIQNMTMIPSDSYDCALCLEVLEHVPSPLQAIREIFRILKPGGIFIFSAPYLSRIHDQPHDYFRFTAYGLRLILTESLFNVIEIVPKGGILCFLGHQISTVLLASTWPFWGMRQVFWFFNKWAITRLMYEIDKMLGGWDFFPLGYVGVAQKPRNLYLHFIPAV